MKLQLKHAFQVSRIMKKMKIRPDIREGMQQEELGMHLMLEAFENIHGAEQEVYEFIGELKGIKPEEIAEWDFNRFYDFVVEFKKIEGLDRFFDTVSKLTK